MALSIPPRACMPRSTISKKAVIASFEYTSTQEYLESLDDDQWQVTSFDPQNRTVCIDVTSDRGIVQHWSLNLPVVSTSWMK